ncbi:MAG: TGS domain-containing protein [Acidimicrobiia bacterium]|nr:TGS domain-containing protein [Acidimicrobiia bacterium]
MPANLTPDYKKAEAAYRRASDSREQLELLREMHRLVPKHKGTEHLRADIKTRIKELTEELAGPKKGGARSGPAHVISVEGPAQVALVGPPNSGKSSLHARLTGSHTQAAAYPFTTQYPEPGMLAFEDIYIQLVDLPPIAREHPVPWIGNALQPAGACLLVVDLTDPDCVERLEALVQLLAERKVYLDGTWPTQKPADRDADFFAIHLPTLLVVNKADLLEDSGADLEVFRELTGLALPATCLSAKTGVGLDQLGRWLFDRLGIVRVYTKLPHKPPDMGQPYALPHGSTVHDAAIAIHKEIAERFQFAKVWGAGDFDGQQVGRDHVLVDGEVLEIHA